MAITVYGIDPSINEAQWSLLFSIASKCAYNEGIETLSDFTVTAGTSPLTSKVAVGNAAIAGVLAKSNTVGTVTHLSNGGGNPRIDTVVLDIDWSGTPTNAGTFTVVRGSNAAAPVPPDLVKVEGVHWQMALANITVDPGVGVFPSGSISTCAPGYRRQIRYTDVIADTSSSPIVAGSDGRVVSSFTVADPGWPYRLMVTGSAQCQPWTHGGHFNLQTYIDGSLLGGGQSGTGGGLAIARSEYSAIITGPSHVSAQIVPENMGGGDTLTTLQKFSGITAIVIPA